MYLFECIVRMGHQGAGRSLDRLVRVRADNAVDALRRAKFLPGVKKGQAQSGGASVLSVALVR
jgi:hypothetical protein